MSVGIRLRVDLDRGCSVGIGKIELLEGIARMGSLSAAARHMGMSYRRAWLLLKDLNSSFDGPVAELATGGRGGGGAVLTALGTSLVAGYRGLESQVEPLAQKCLSDIAGRVAARGRRAAVAKRAPRRGRR